MFAWKSTWPIVISKGILLKGTYFVPKDSRPAEWVITEKPLPKKGPIFCFPYRGHRHMYNFIFYCEKIENTKLWQILQRYVKKYGVKPLVPHSRERILLMWDRIDGFDHKLNCLVSMRKGRHTDDDLSGVVCYVDLHESLPPKKQKG